MDKKIVALVRASKTGMRVQEIAEAAGLSRSTTGDRLSAYRAAGILDVVVNNNGGFWTIPERVDEIRQQALEHFLREAKARGQWAVNRLMKRWNLTQQQIDGISSDGELSEVPIQRVVSAKDCEPMKIKGPVSVWDLA